MARTWTMKEIIEAIEKADPSEIKELGKRFPMLTFRLIGLLKSDITNQFRDFVVLLPEYVTPLKLEKICEGTAKITDAYDGSDPEEDMAEEIGKVSESEEEARRLLEQRRKNDRERQARKRSKAKDLAAAETDDTKDVKAAPRPVNSPYEEIAAVDLYRMCVTRKIKAETRQPQRYYINLLTEADAAAEKEKEAAENDIDWGDEGEGSENLPVEEKSPAKKGRKSSPSKKESVSMNPPAEEAEEFTDENEDENWEL